MNDTGYPVADLHRGTSSKRELEKFINPKTEYNSVPDLNLEIAYGYHAVQTARIIIRYFMYRKFYHLTGIGVIMTNVEADRRNTKRPVTNGLGKNKVPRVDHQSKEVEAVQLKWPLKG